MGEDRQRRELLARLEAAMEENAGLHAQLLTQAREAGMLDERQRMAREIHDTLAQGLTGIITSWRPPSGPVTIPSSGAGTRTRPAPWPATASRRRAGRCRRCAPSRW
jgi:Histidine kinase